MLVLFCFQNNLAGCLSDKKNRVAFASNLNIQLFEFCILATSNPERASKSHQASFQNKTIKLLSENINYPYLISLCMKSETVKHQCKPESENLKKRVTALTQVILQSVGRSAVKHDNKSNYAHCKRYKTIWTQSHVVAPRKYQTL